MKIDLLLFPFSSLLFFFYYAITIALPFDLGDYAFVNLESADVKMKDLRVLLDRRGLSYHDFNEKSEYINALIESGPLTVGELKIARNSNPDSIISDDAVKELVDDIKFENDVPENILNSEDKIWLVRIEPNTESRTNILEEAVWRRLIKMLDSFDVQFGQFDCKKAAEYCASKSWNSPTLLLVAPRLHKGTQLATKAEAHVLKPVKNGVNQWVYEADSVMKQIYTLLNGKLVPYLPTQADFDGLQTTAFHCSVHFVLLTNLRQCPFMLSALAAKFNNGIHCLGYGPKTISRGTLKVPDNQVGAIYAIKSHYYYESTWQIISNNQSTDGVKDDMFNTMITFESLIRLLNKYSPTEAKELKAEEKKPSATVKIPPTLPIYTYRKRGSSKSLPNSKFDYRIYLSFFSNLFDGIVYVAFPLLGCLLGCVFCIAAYSERNRGRQRAAEFARYQSHIINRYRSNEQNFWRNFRLLEQAKGGETSTIDSSHLSSNQEFPLRSMEEYFSILSLRFQHLADWHKKTFVRYNFYETVSTNTKRLLDRYEIDIEEIGFPPYNWILRLPTVEISDLSEDIRQSECPICQRSIDNNDDRLCRLPCNCKDTIYHYDCIAPWLVKREDPNSHNFMSWKLHTERPCPTCRFDVTIWGLQQLVNDE